MLSMITEPPIRIGICRPISVTTGIRAFGAIPTGDVEALQRVEQDVVAVFAR